MGQLNAEFGVIGMDKVRNRLQRLLLLFVPQPEVLRRNTTILGKAKDSKDDEGTKSVSEGAHIVRGELDNSPAERSSPPSSRERRLE